MSVIAKKLDQVLERTQKLVETSKALQELNEQLILENQSLKVALEASENKRKDLEEKLRVLKLAKSLEEVFAFIVFITKASGSRNAYF